MRLSRKIFLSFMSLILMVFILGGAGIYYLQSNSKNVNEISTLQDIVLTYDNISFQTVRANAAIRGYMLYEEAYMKENHLEIRETLHHAIDELRDLGGEGDGFDQYLLQLDEWETAIDEEIIPLVENGEVEEAKEISKPILGEGSTNLVVYGKELASEYSEEVTKDFNAISSDSKTMFVTVLIVSILSFVVSLLLWFLFGRNLSRSIQKVIAGVNTFATGDFNVQLDLKSKDEFGELSESFNEMTHQLSGTMHEINDSSSQVAAMSEEISASSEEVSSATNEITNSIMNISEGIENQDTMTSNVRSLAGDVLTEMKRILENVDLTRKRVDDTDQISQESQQEVDEVNKQMSVILANSEAITSDINELNRDTQSITESIDLIKEIAEQTNLLALNASIEASRAGENGKGFAVVADEVRKLAEASNNASVSIEEVVQTISSKIKQTVETIENNNDSVKEGQVRVLSNGEAFDEITNSISTVKDQTDYVQTAIHTIFDNIEQLVKEIESTSEISRTSNDLSQGIAAASEEQSAAMGESSDAANELAKLATELQGLIQRYKF